MTKTIKFSDGEILYKVVTITTPVNVQSMGSEIIESPTVTIQNIYNKSTIYFEIRNESGKLLSKHKDRSNLFLNIVEEVSSIDEFNKKYPFIEVCESCGGFVSTNDYIKDHPAYLHMREDGQCELCMPKRD